MTWPNLMRNCNKIAFACGLYVCALQLERVISVISAITLSRNTTSAELVLSLSLPPCQSSVWVWIGQAVTVQEYGSSSNVWLNHRHFVLGIKLQQWHLALGALQNIPLRTPQHSCPLKILIDQFIRNKRPTLYIYSTSFHQVLAVLSFEKLKQLLSRFKIFKKSQDHLLTRFANISQKVLKKERPKKRFPGKYFPESAFLMC